MAGLASQTGDIDCPFFFAALEGWERIRFPFSLSSAILSIICKISHQARTGAELVQYLV